MKNLYNDLVGLEMELVGSKLDTAPLKRAIWSTILAMEQRKSEEEIQGLVQKVRDAFDLLFPHQ